MSIANSVATWLDDFSCLFFPRICPSCNEHLSRHAQVVCALCQFQLPKTDFHKQKDNPFTAKFRGRVPIEAGASFFYFVKEGKAQELIHLLKYKGRLDIAVKIGQLYGKCLRESDYFQEVQVIVPVPLHPKRLLERGYNQSEGIAQGIAEALKVPHLPHALSRTKFIQSQTQMNVLDRRDNVKNNFSVMDEKGIAGKHILLVDDVMTTGATMEACANAVGHLPNTKLSMTTIAYTTI